MGLDMFVYKTNKPDLDAGRVYNRSELENYVVLKPKDVAMDKFKQVLPFTQKLRVVNSYYNMKKIREDCHMPDAEIGMCSLEKVGIVGKVDGVRTMETIPIERFLDLYTIECEQECFVFDQTHVAYWRNEFDLRTLIWNALGRQIQNMGYYLLNKEATEIINGNGYQLQLFEPEETSDLFYWEWH